MCKQLTDMCVRVPACVVNVKGGLRLPYGSQGKALFDQHASLAQTTDHFLMLPSACMAVHLEMKHGSLNRVPLITLSHPLSQLFQTFLTERCVHTKTMFCLFLRQLLIHLSRRVFLTLSLCLCRFSIIRVIVTQG